MEEAWRLPDGYNNEQIVAALSPLSAFLPKAMTLYEQGDSLAALGVCFDLLDMLIVLKDRDLDFFETTNETILYSKTLMEVTLYPICKMYKDKRLPQEAKKEIFSRFEDYNTYYNFLEDNGFGNFKPTKIIQKYGGFHSEQSLTVKFTNNT